MIAIISTLFTDQNPRAASFQKKIRSYNSALAFTSVNTGKEDRVDLRHGLTTFMAHGEMYHLQGPLIPGSQESPAFAQLFFYDPEYAADLGRERDPQLDSTILRDLHAMMMEVNPLIRIYETARERLQVQQGNFRMVISPQMTLVVQTGADCRWENLPVTGGVAAIIPDEYNKASFWDVILAVREPDQEGQ